MLNAISKITSIILKVALIGLVLVTGGIIDVIDIDLIDQEKKMTHQEDRLKQFIENLKRIEGEILLLNVEKKDLFSDFKDDFDPKVLREAVRSVKARLKLGDSVVQLDEIVETLEKEYTI